MRLVISDNEGAMAVVPLVRDEIAIGRKDGNTIRLTERNVSRQHCRIQRGESGFVIHDLGSYNGVLVNGQRIEGEAPIKPGDEIRVGDYTLVLEGDASKSAESSPQLQAAPKPVSAQAVPVALPAPQPPSPATAELAPLLPPPRLVVLTAPLAGAEYSLPERGELRIGRSPELDIAIEHRSVSREHARIVCEDGVARISDMGSVNGVIVNGKTVKEAVLAPDDRVELGDIVLRYVGAGQSFVFEPGGLRSALARRRGPILAAAILVGSAVVAMVILHQAGRGSVREVTLGAGKSKPAPPSAAAEPAAIPMGSSTQRVELREACRRANDDQRYPEAIANANAALKLDANDAEAQACGELARANHEQEQAFLRAKAAIEAGDDEAAWRELQALPASGPVVRRADVAALIADTLQARLERGRALLPDQPIAAAELARDAEELVAAPEPLRARARALIAQAEATPARAQAARHAPKRTRETATAPVGGDSAAASPRSSGAKSSTLEAAQACLSRGDSRCAIKVLNGHTETARELALLIETYRMLGNVEQAYRNMRAYVQRFPNGESAHVYRELLQRAAR